MSNSAVVSNTNLLVCCNILNRIETLLEVDSRVQISKDNLSSIGDYLVKAIKYIDASIPIFGTQLIIFGNCISAVTELIETNRFVSTNVDTKQYLNDRLHSTIIEFKVNVGKHLCNNEFNYIPSMDTIIKDIIELCISNNYYFDL